MPIINVNTFQDGISRKDYLTTYTDQYIKQSLANLGQRVGIKGDSVVNGSFTASEMFSDYLGDFEEKNKFIMLTYNVAKSCVTGNIVKYDEDSEEVKTVVGNNNQTDVNSTFTLSNVTNTITSIDDYDDYKNGISIEDGNIINGIEYYHSTSAIIQKTDNWYQYSLVGHKTGDTTYLNYDKEYIVERISTTNEFEDGIRICIKNEQNIDRLKENGLDCHEHLCMFHLYKNYEYDSTVDGSHPYYLDLYNVETLSNTYLEIGDFTITENNINDIDDSIYNGVQHTASPTNILTYIYTDKKYPLDSNVNPPSLTLVAEKMPIDFDNEDNVKFSVSSSFEWWSGNKLLNTMSSHSQSDDDKDDETTDKEYINDKLQYFSNDLVNLYPVVQDVFDNIMYQDSDGTKLKRQIFASLIRTIYQNNIESKENTDEFTIYLPCDYKLVYNCNSSDINLIYNTIQNVNVQCVDDYIRQDKSSTINIYDYIQRISNVNEENSNIIIASGYVTRNTQYLLTITYINDELVDVIDWEMCFVMPYVDDDGYWVINGEHTDVYAKGIAESISNIIMMSSKTPDGDYDTSGIIHCADKDIFEDASKMKYEKKKAVVNVGDTTNLTIEAWVPSSESMSVNADTEVLAAVKNALLINLSSSYMQTSPNIYDNKAYFTYSDISYIKKYLATHNEMPTDTYTSIKEGRAKSDWIVYVGPNDGTYTSYVCTISTDSLLYKLGSDGLITTIWHAEYDADNSSYSFNYIPRPDDSNLALDIQYMSGLEQYVKYYSSESTNLDKSIFDYIVFSDTNRQLKNNVEDAHHTSWPVIKNNDEIDYSQKDYDPVSSITNGVDNYKNNLNFTLGFYDNVTITDGLVDNVANDEDRRHFNINSVSYEVSIPKATYKDGTLSTEYVYISYTLGTIPYITSLKEFAYEYVPNAGTYLSKYYQYPFFDMKEVLARNVNVMSRTNIISTEKHDVGNGTSLNVLYNAYIGVPYDSPNKSILHIGTSDTNISLGTTTMVGADDLSKMTPMEGLSIDFDNTKVSGNLSVGGKLEASSNLWTKSQITNGEYSYTVYSTILYPSSKYTWLNDNTTNNFINGDDTNLFGVRQVTTPTTTRYLAQVTKHNVSYLNVNRLLAYNDIILDESSIVRGDAISMNPSYLMPKTGNVMTYTMELSTDLTNNENVLVEFGDDVDKEVVVSSNPIQVTYVDIPYTQLTYAGEKTYKTIYTYLQPISYTEVWYCDGCTYCNGDDCPMIKYCGHSSRKGCFQYSYSFTEDKDDYEKMYTQELIYYTGDSNGNNTVQHSYTLIAYSVLYEKVPEVYQDSTTYIIGNVNENGEFKEDELGSYIAQYSGKNYVGLVSIPCYSYKYGELDNNDENQGLINDGIKSYIAELVSYIPVRLTYMETVEAQSDLYYTAYRKYVNVREIMTSHSTPRYSNGHIIR